MSYLHLDNSIIQRLSMKELTILKYTYEHPEEVSKMTIHDLSDAVSLSSATILRFCKKLNLSGFSELKFVLRQRTQETNKPVHPSFKLSQQLILDNIKTEVIGTSNLMQNEHLEEIIHLLDSDYSLYLWAPGGITSILVDYLERLLFIHGRQKVYRLASERLATHVFHKSAEPAIFFVISTSGTYEPTIRLARLAKTNGMLLIAVTPFNNREIAQLTPYNLHFFTTQRENVGADITSRVSIFYLLTMLIQTYEAHQRGE